MSKYKAIGTKDQLRQVARDALGFLGGIAALSPASKAHAFPGGDSDGGGCGNAGDGGNQSCPFLCAWDGNQFVFDNDFLHGKPTTLFPSVAAGMRTYERGAVRGDILKLSSACPAEGRLHFQIREIEPEQSFIDAVSLERVCHPRGTSVYIDGDLETVHAVPDRVIDTRADLAAQTVSTSAGEAIDWVSDPERRYEKTARTMGVHEPTMFLPLDTGDYITIVGRLSSSPDKTTDVLLFLESYFRDWTAGTMLTGKHAAGALSTGAPRARTRTRAWAVATIAGVLGTGMLANAAWLKAASDRLVHIPESIIPAAHADNPPSGKSLVVEYWDGATWVHIETVTPRHYRPSVSLIRTPREAFDASGTVRLRIRATKRHHVTSCFLFCNDHSVSGTERKAYAPAQAVHRREGRDYAALLARRDHTYMRTIPADVVDLAFDLPPPPDAESRSTTLLFRSHGFYVPADEATQREAGDWVRNLDPDSYALLRSLTALGDRRADSTSKRGGT